MGSGSDSDNDDSPVLHHLRDVHPNLKTGDIILLWGLSSKKVVQVYYEYKGTPGLLETTSRPLHDMVTDKPLIGVKVTNFWKSVFRKDVYPKGCVRHLTGVTVDQHQEMVKKLEEFLPSVHGRNYETDSLELIKSEYDGPGGHNEEDLKELFCSELVAEALQAMGVINPERPSNEYAPGDFSSVHGSNDLPFLEGIGYCPDMSTATVDGPHAKEGEAV